MRPYPEIIEELKEKDPVLKTVSAHAQGELTPTPSIDIYYYLLNSIISQQLSTRVAEIIWRRFLDIFPEQYPEPLLLMNKEDHELRDIGLSYQKAGYMKNVADFSVEFGMNFEQLHEKSDEEFISYLTQIKGVGKWTAQMVLMFPMDRPNVFPVDDLGIQTKMKKYYNIRLEKKELKQKIIAISEKWHPYKTLASKLLWNAG
ncbi:MAG: hypothetical protein WDZ35_16465 [Crocinitomicaceae bacterium]